MVRHGLLVLMAAGLSLAVTPWVRRLAVRLGVVDKPGGHRLHHERVPRLGGLAVLMVWLGVLGASLPLESRLFSHALSGSVGHWSWLFAGVLVIFATGVADDIWNLLPELKLGLEIAAGVMALLGGFCITTVTLPFISSSITLGWMAAPLTLLWVVGITNGFNLLDGLDGLAAGIAVIALVTVWAVSLTTGRVDVAFLVVTLAGALTGFLYHNFPPASIFMGDSGSLLLGYVLAVLSMQASHHGGLGVVVLVPLLALGLPILDTLLAVMRRLWRAVQAVRSDPERKTYHVFIVGPAAVMRPDRAHVHHYLLAMGLSPRRALLALYGVSAGLGLLALLVLSTTEAPTTVAPAGDQAGQSLGVWPADERGQLAIHQFATKEPSMNCPVCSQASRSPDGRQACLSVVFTASDAERAT